MPDAEERAARSGPNGELIPLDEQDRSLWDQRLIAKGVVLLSEALARGSVGPYQLQAAIAAIHSEAARVEETDWPQILALYGLLKRMSDNPMVALNHAIAAAGDHESALVHYRAAAERTTSFPERNYLTARMARLAASHRGPSACEA